MNKQVKLKDLSAAQRAMADPASKAKLTSLINQVVEQVKSKKESKNATAS